MYRLTTGAASARLRDALPPRKVEKWSGSIPGLCDGLFTEVTFVSTSDRTLSVKYTHEERRDQRTIGAKEVLRYFERANDEPDEDSRRFTANHFLRRSRLLRHKRQRRLMRQADQDAAWKSHAGTSTPFLTKRPARVGAGIAMTKPAVNLRCAKSENHCLFRLCALRP